MKILLVQDHLRSGGTERQTLLLARGFAAAGHATTLLTFRPGGALAGPEPAGPDSRPDFRVTHRALQPFDTGLDWFAPGLMSATENLRPDVILCMGRMANCYAGSLQQLVQDRWPQIAVVATMRTGKRLPWLFRRSLRQVRHIVANSRAARQTLVTAYAIPAEKISVIYNSLVFPPGALAARNDALRREQGAGPGTTVLLCVAMFRPGKNQGELIEIAAGLPPDLDWQLWLAGDGPTRAACVRLAAENNLSARVKFPGWQRDPGPLYSAADIAVHASSSESLSNFLIEAQAHGLPVVAAEAQGITECFLPGETGFAIPPRDHAAFRSALVRLAHAPADRRATCAARSRAHALATFDPQQQVATYLGLLQKLSAPSS